MVSMTAQAESEEGGGPTAGKTEPEAGNQTADIYDHIKVFLEENGRARSMEITEEMKGLGYSKNAARDALQELKKQGEVKQLKDADGNPVNKYEREVNQSAEEKQVCRDCGREIRHIGPMKLRDCPEHGLRTGEEVEVVRDEA